MTSLHAIMKTTNHQVCYQQLKLTISLLHALEKKKNTSLGFNKVGKMKQLHIILEMEFQAIFSSKTT